MKTPFNRRAALLSLLWSLTYLSASELGLAAPSFDPALKDYATLRGSPDTSSDGEILEAIERVNAAWSALPDAKKAEEWSRIALVNYTAAEIFARLGRLADAWDSLHQEGQLQKKHGGKIEYSTKNSLVFFENLINLQALLTNRVGSDPLSDLVGYDFFEVGQREYAAARRELWNDLFGIEVPDIAPDETLVTFLRVEEEEDAGVYSRASIRWFVIPRGEGGIDIANARREILFDPDGGLKSLKLDPTTTEKPSKEEHESADAISANESPSGQVGSRGTSTFPGTSRRSLIADREGDRQGQGMFTATIVVFAIAFSTGLLLLFRTMIRRRQSSAASDLT